MWESGLTDLPSGLFQGLVQLKQLCVFSFVLVQLCSFMDYLHQNPTLSKFTLYRDTERRTRVRGWGRNGTAAVYIGKEGMLRESDR